MIVNYSVISFISFWSLHPTHIGEVCRHWTPLPDPNDEFLTFPYCYKSITSQQKGFIYCKYASIICIYNPPILLIINISQRTVFTIRYCKNTKNLKVKRKNFTFHIFEPLIFSSFPSPPLSDATRQSSPPHSTSASLKTCQ